jgi:hypothetical protein
MNPGRTVAKPQVSSTERRAVASEQHLPCILVRHPRQPDRSVSCEKIYTIFDPDQTLRHAEIDRLRYLIVVEPVVSAALITESLLLEDRATTVRRVASRTSAPTTNSICASSIPTSRCSPSSRTASTPPACWWQPTARSGRLSRYWVSTQPQPFTSLPKAWAAARHLHPSAASALAPPHS